MPKKKIDSTRLSPAGRRYGACHDIPDARDLTLASARLSPPALHFRWKWPFFFSDSNDHVGTGPTGQKLVDLRAWLGPVKDQGDLGACTGFANCGLREFLSRKYYAYEKNRIANPVFSPLFLYYMERSLEGTIQQDGGAQMRTGMVVMNHMGVCLETEDPYAPADFTRAPNSDQVAQALLHTSGSYHRLVDLADMRSSLLSGYAFTMGIPVYQSFESTKVAKTGMVPMPDTSKEQVLGGHAVLAAGYDDERRVFIMRNSWGTNWGDHGDFYLPYDYVKQYAYDCWMAHLGPAW